MHALAVSYITISVLCALWAVYDLSRRGQSMRVMNVVWPVTMLYLGPIGLAAYHAFGRARLVDTQVRTPIWQSAFKGACHCGAGCAIGDFLGDWIAFAFAFTLWQSEFAGKAALSFVLAFLFGIIFQYFAIAPMRHLGIRDGIALAIKIDALSLLAYEVGMLAWMGLRTVIYPRLAPNQLEYWFMMQIAMIIGFVTTYPVNWWLIRRGTKEAM